MLTFAQFVEELSKDEIMISPTEVRGMLNRFGPKTLQMGHLQEDGSMVVPVDCVVEAARSLGSSVLAGVAETLRSEQMVSLLESAEALVVRVGEARKKRLGRTVEDFQSEPSDGKARQQWKEIEKTIFGVEYQD
jgi:hypothetical protein